VEDDGIGFDPAAIRSGMGLRNIVERVRAMGGTLDVDSTPRHGTTVNVTVRIG
jgi:signal transduction histidine kinase